MTTRVFQIIGKALDHKTRRGLAGIRIVAWDKDLVYDDQVGSAVTDTLGGFQITFSESAFREFFGDRQPDLYFKVFRSAERRTGGVGASSSQSMNVRERNRRGASGNGVRQSRVGVETAA